MAYRLMCLQCVCEVYLLTIVNKKWENNKCDYSQGDFLSFLWLQLELLSFVVVWWNPEKSYKAHFQMLAHLPFSALTVVSLQRCSGLPNAACLNMWPSATNSQRRISDVLRGELLSAHIKCLSCAFDALNLVPLTASGLTPWVSGHRRLSALWTAARRPRGEFDKAYNGGASHLWVKCVYATPQALLGITKTKQLTLMKH